jgi:glycosyltransferase involved in cell wall biosynthesis
MKVLYLVNIPFLGRASTTVATEGWLRFLRPKGLEPVLACHQPGEFFAWAKKEAIPAYHVCLPFPNKRWPWSFLWSIWQLRRIVKRHGIQLIHCNEHDIYPIGRYLASSCRLPVLVNIHCRMHRRFCEWAFTGKRRPQRLFFLSKGSREVCREAISGIVPETDWRLLYNGLDLDAVRPDPERGATFRARHGLGQGLLVGAASWLRPGKQLDQTMAAFARVRTPGIRLVLAGGIAPGEEAYAKQLMDEGRRLLGPRLLHLGCVDDLPGFYNALDLYINTSKEETCSISIMEALACGCPVVGYPSTSVDEQVLPCGGEIVEQDNINHLTTALERWLTDRVKLQAARAGARRRAEDVFDIRKLSDQLWNEYQSLLEPSFSERRLAKAAAAR